MNIEEILNKIYTSDLLSSEELHELTEWVCNKDKEIERLKNIINKAIDILKNDITAYISKKPFDETIPRVIRILQGVDKE